MVPSELGLGLELQPSSSAELLYGSRRIRVTAAGTGSGTQALAVALPVQAQPEAHHDARTSSVFLPVSDSESEFIMFASALAVVPLAVTVLVVLLARAFSEAELPPQKDG